MIIVTRLCLNIAGLHPHALAVGVLVSHLEVLYIDAGMVVYQRAAHTLINLSEVSRGHLVLCVKSLNHRPVLLVGGIPVGRVDAPPRIAIVDAMPHTVKLLCQGVIARIIGVNQLIAFIAA